MRKVALIIDPEWRHQSIDLKQYQAHVKTQLGQLPPIDFLMTAVSRDDEYVISEWFRDGTGNQYNASWPCTSIPSPHFPNTANSIGHWNKQNWLNHKIMSAKLTETDKKTKTARPVANRILVNTSYGLMNANAGVDAVTRMLTNTKHKIDQIIIIDPFRCIYQNHLTNRYGQVTEIGIAYIYTQANPHIPFAVIV